MPHPSKRTGKAGWIYEQPGLVKGVPAQMIFNVPSNSDHSMMF